MEEGASWQDNERVRLAWIVVVARWCRGKKKEDFSRLFLSLPCRPLRILSPSCLVALTMRAVLSLSLAVLGPWLLAYFVGRTYLSSLCRTPVEEASSSALLVEATPLLLSLVAAALPYVLFSKEGKGGRARAVLFTVLLLGAALCMWLLLSAAHGLKDRGLCQMAAPGNTTGEVDALRESQHVLGLLYPSSVARLEELALRPLQENSLRSEQLQLFLELRQTLDKLA